MKLVISEVIGKDSSSGLDAGWSGEEYLKNDQDIETGNPAKDLAIQKAKEMIKKVKVNFGVKLSKGQQEAKEFFSSGTGVMVIAQAKCITHWIYVNTLTPPAVSFCWLAILYF